MRFYAAKAMEDHPPGGTTSGRRSSPLAEAIALAGAAAALAIAVFYRGPQLWHSGNHLYLALAITVAFALAARLAHGVNTSGAIAGAAIAFVFVLARIDFRLFWLLLVVFFVTLAATRAGRLRKQQLQIAEAQRGRSASQVMANLAVASLLLAIPRFDSAHLLALAALAEVAADTTSSEIGAASSTRTVLITSWKDVPPGTDGGISMKGTVAGVFAALITAAFALGLGLVNASGMLVVAAAGTAGMLVDSVLGGSLERRGYLNNDVVNLVSTAAAAGIAWLSL
ncbi:MAG TPA: DUF92 domain-containing protein [Candidatus Angelobacter sp.]